MFSFLKKKEMPLKEKQEEKGQILSAFISGKVISIEETPDPVFAQKVMGGGVAIEPVEEVLVAPCDAEVTVVMEDTKHAVGIQSADGMEILLHAGLETVNMKGEGFTLFVKPGQLVRRGQKLLSFETKKIIEKGYNTICIMVISNEEKFDDLVYKTGMQAKKGETVIADY